MMKYLIDANIFLEAQLNQGKSKVCKEFLEELRDGSIDGAVTMFHVDSISVSMENYGHKDKISGFLISLYMYDGLDVLNLELSAKAEAMMSENGLSFDDSLAVKAFEERNFGAIISYDTDFDDKIRKTPEEVLENTTS